MRNQCRGAFRKQKFTLSGSCFFISCHSDYAIRTITSHTASRIFWPSSRPSLSRFLPISASKIGRRSLKPLPDRRDKRRQLIVRHITRTARPPYLICNYISPPERKIQARPGLPTRPVVCIYIAIYGDRRVRTFRIPAAHAIK